ncbi:MAG: HD-GYP domain-containing protein [Methylococcales bacterium]|nr:HD-GYP domain-containing protein [Methylococcales bacterium]
MIKYETVDVEIGMFVSTLDRPWVGTPFLFQSFLIKSEKQIQQLQKYCRTVDIDEEKSNPALANKFFIYKCRTVGAKPVEESFVPSTQPRQAPAKFSLRPEDKEIEQNLNVARQVYESTTTSLHSVLNDFRLNKEINPVELKTCVHGVIDGVVHNPSALALFSNLKSRQQDTVRHSLNVCILSLLFGRHLGLNEKQLSDLGYAALLHDVGEIKVSQEILDKHNRGLTPEEKKEMEKHSQYGAEILLSTPDIPGVAIEVARSHHERVNGKGYPKGLKDTEINYFARLVSIVDVYEIVTNHPGAKVHVSCSDALKSIYMMRGSFFDRELVEEFIKCLGIYPVGSVVELNNGEIAIVISTKPGRHLLPTIMVVKNSQGVLYQPLVVNLEHFKEKEGLSKLHITKVVDPNAVGIDLSDYMIRESSMGQ